MKEAALQALETIDRVQKAYDLLNRHIMETTQDKDFGHGTINAMAPDIENAVVKLLDEVLGDTIASYFLYECSVMKDGGFVQEGDNDYRIKTIDDLRAYVGRNV